MRLNALTPIALTALLTALPAVAAEPSSDDAASAASSASTEAPSVFRSLVVEYETGAVRILSNDGCYGEACTFYTAEETGQQRVLFVAQRLAVELGFGQRHTAIFLYAPLDVTTTTSFDHDLSFRDQIFPAGTVLQHRYKFDGIRASYLYRVLDGERLRIELGGTLQIRNALVEFTSADGERYGYEDDIGIVPALKGRLTYTLPNGVYGLFEVDGISGFGLLPRQTEGSVLDAALSLGLPVTKGADFVFKLRLYGGGAKVPAQRIESGGWYAFATAGVRGDLVALFKD